MYGYSMVNECCSLLHFDRCMQCSLYVGYGSSPVGHICAMWQVYFVQGHMTVWLIVVYTVYKYGDCSCK